MLSIVIRSCSPALFSTTQTVGAPDSEVSSPPSPSVSVSQHGGLIQFSGLYARSSACTLTEPSALMSKSLLADGRWAVSRPT